MVLPVVDTLAIPLPPIVTLPPELDNVTVLLATDNVCNSLVADASTALTVATPANLLTVTPVPATTSIIGNKIELPFVIPKISLTNVSD